MSRAQIYVAFRGGALFFARVLTRLVKLWLPLCLWMIVIFGASTELGSPRHTSRFIRPFLLWLNPHMSEENIEKAHHFIRKTAHFVEYAFLGILAWRVAAFEPALGKVTSLGPLLLALLFCALFASTDEFHQKFVPTRQPAVTDVCLDTGGAACGLLGVWGVRRLLSKK